MVRGGHFAAEDITDTSDTTKHLRESYTRLCDLSSLRKLKLNDAVESQQFYFKLSERARPPSRSRRRSRCYGSQTSRMKRTSSSTTSRR